MAVLNETTLSSLIQGWGKGLFHRVYLLGGPDTLTKEEALSRLKKEFLGNDPSGMGLDSFDGNDTTVGAILSAVNTLPFFGGRRLVVVKRAMELSTADTNRLADGLSTLPPTNCLVLLWDEKPDQRSVLVQAVRSAGALTTLWPPFENQMPAWVMSRVESAGKRMDRAAAQALLDAVGPSLPDLVQEIGKLVLYVKDRPSIALEDVEACGGTRATMRFMEWERSLWRKDRVKSLGLLELMRSNGDPTEKLLPQLSRAIQKLCLGKALFGENTLAKKQVFDRLWIRLQDAQTDFEKALALWTWGDLLGALDRLVEADVSMKTGRGSPDADLTRLVWSLTEGEVVGLKRR
ncbi:MAG: DNA polymerase III subunit delta [Elusimicrobia bacterium]|nr:DNA polymerase III subunit delta [Elusimicrobiota bacterium]